MPAIFFFFFLCRLAVCSGLTCTLHKCPNTLICQNITCYVLLKAVIVTVCSQVHASHSCVQLAISSGLADWLISFSSAQRFKSLALLRVLDAELNKSVRNFSTAPLIHFREFTDVTAWWKHGIFVILIFFKLLKSRLMKSKNIILARHGNYYILMLRTSASILQTLNLNESVMILSVSMRVWAACDCQ